MYFDVGSTGRKAFVMGLTIIESLSMGLRNGLKDVLIQIQNFRIDELPKRKGNNMKIKLLPLFIVLLIAKAVSASNELSVGGGGAYSSASELTSSALAIEGFHTFDLPTLDLSLGAGYVSFGKVTGNIASTGNQTFNESYQPSAVLIEARISARIGKARPYFVGGIGQVHQTFSVVGATFVDGSSSGSSSSTGLMGGIGMTYDVIDHIFVGAEARDMYISQTTVGGTSVPSSMIVSVLAKAGVRF